MTWDLMRASGLVLLVLFSGTVALGVVTSTARAGGAVPALVPRTLHRDLALASTLLLTLHVVTAVLDTYVDISWWAVLVPGVSAYEPLWVGLGALAFDLLIVVGFTSALRQRLGLRVWRGVHLSAYAAWPIAVAHGIALGTDLKAGSAVALWITAGSVALVVMAATYRLARLSVRRWEPTP